MMFTMNGITIAIIYDKGHIIDDIKSLHASGI